MPTKSSRWARPKLLLEALEDRAVPAAPTISNVTDKATNEDTPTAAIGFSVGDAETPADQLVVTAASSNAGLVPVAGIALGGAGAARTVRLTPAANQTGTATITLTVRDGAGQTASDTFVLTVRPVNDLPTVSAVADLGVNPGRSTDAIPFTVGDVETSAAGLTVTATSSNQAAIPNANIVVGGTGASRTVTVTPAGGQTGKVTVTLKVVDADGGSTTEAFVVGVRGYAADLPLPDAVPAKDTSGYTVPAGAIYVSPAGSAGADGSAAKPYTLRQAVDRINASAALSGATVVLLAGTYRGGNLTVNRKATFQAAPGADPVLKGSVVVSDWQAENGVWWTDTTPAAGGNFEFPWSAITYGEPHQYIDPLFPEAGNREQVYVDGRPLWQVGSLAELTADTFVVDRDADRLYLGRSPAAATVEVTAHSRGLAFFRTSGGQVVDGGAVRGLNFRHYADHGLVAQRDRFVLEDSTFAWNGQKGLDMANANDMTARNSTFVANGRGGAGMGGARRAVVDGNTFAFNNAERYTTFWDAAGIKITRTEDLTFRNNLVEKNYATAVWLDISMFRTWVVNNTIRHNLSIGAFVEISHDNVVAFNLIHDNGTGVMISGASATRVYNNTLANNSTAVAVKDTDRVNDVLVDDGVTGGGGAPDGNPVEGGESEAAERAGATWDAYANVILNNIFADVRGSTVVDADDSKTKPTRVGNGSATRAYYTEAEPSSPTMIAQMDWNAYWRSSTSRTPNTNTWDPPGSARYQSYGTVAAFTAATGYEGNALEFSNVPDPFFVNPAAGDYRLRADNPAVGRGAPVPADVLAAAGRSAADPAHLGAFHAENYRPAIAGVADRTTAEDTPAGPIPVRIGDRETPAGALVLTAASSNPELVPVGNVAFGGAGPDRTVTVTPARDKTGSATVTLTVRDAAGATATTSFVVTVTPVNDPPAVSPLADRTVDEDTGTGPIPFTVGDPETPAGALTATAASSDPGLVPAGNIVLGGSGADRTVAVTPAANRSGTATITVSVADPDGAVTTRAFVLTVAPVNDAPTAVADVAATAEGRPVAVPVLANDADPDGDPLGVAAVTQPANGTAAVFGASVRYTPRPGFYGPDSFTYTASDGRGGTATATVRVDVRPVDHLGIPRALGPIAVDGAVDPGWAGAPAAAVGNPVQPGVTGPADLSATFRTLWDADALYVLVEVTDDVARPADSGAGRWYDDDTVEVFVDANHDRLAAYGPTDYQFAVRPTGPVLEVKRGATAGVLAARVPTPVGYRVEVRLPWATLGQAPAFGGRLGLDVHVNDDDDGGARDGKLAWHATADTSYADPRALATARLDPGGYGLPLWLGTRGFPAARGPAAAPPVDPPAPPVPLLGVDVSRHGSRAPQSLPADPVTTRHAGS